MGPLINKYTQESMHTLNTYIRLFTQPFIQAQIKENINAPRHWTLWGEFTGEFPAQRSSNAENVSIWCDVIMA